jgi:anti-sigma regulatory factor (Ser/Thr protein kinase)
VTTVRVRGEEIRSYILEHVKVHSTDISRWAATHFKVSRQAINKHLQRLVHEGALAESGNTRQRSYSLAPLVEWNHTYNMSEDLQEDVVWRNDVSLALGEQPENVMDIWQYGFTEMFNNARDHSNASTIRVRIWKTAIDTQMLITDTGVGIFRKIQRELNLLDDRHAVFELAKGKLTTDPRRHTGEGIFFTSRMFDSFDIVSAGVFFSHKFGTEYDWVIQLTQPEESGTSVWLKLKNHTARTTKKIFDQFTSGGTDYGFTKTIVPVGLAQYGNDKLISRSQAKRVLARIELFKTVIFDFKGVPTIGQAFADEVFRVFANQHPEIQFYVRDANADVSQMIERAKSGSAIEEPVSNNSAS